MAVFLISLELLILGQKLNRFNVILVYNPHLINMMDLMMLVLFCIRGLAQYRLFIICDVQAQLISLTDQLNVCVFDMLEVSSCITIRYELL